MPTEGPHADLDSRQSLPEESGTRPLPSTPDEVDPPIIPDPNPKRERRGDEVVLRDFDKIQEKKPITVDPAHLKIAVAGVLAIIAVAGLVGWLLGRAPAPHKRTPPVVTAVVAVQKSTDTDRRPVIQADRGEPAGQAQQAEKGEPAGRAQKATAPGADTDRTGADADRTGADPAQSADDNDQNEEGRVNSTVTASVLPLPTHVPTQAPTPTPTPAPAIAQNPVPDIATVPVPVPVPDPVPTPPPTRRPTTGQSPKPRGIEKPAKPDIMRRMAADTREIETSIRKAAEAAERAMFQLWPPLAITSCDYSCISPDGVCLPDNPPPKKTPPAALKTTPSEAIALTAVPPKPAPVKVDTTTAKPTTTNTVEARPIPARPAPAKPTPAKTAKEPEPKKYSVQVRSFKEKELAEQHADLLKSKGYNPYVITFTDPSGVEWFRVRMGNFDSPAEASAFSRELNAKEAEQSIPMEAK